MMQFIELIKSCMNTIVKYRFIYLSLGHMVDYVLASEIMSQGLSFNLHMHYTV